MGMNLDTAERTAKREAEKAKRIGEITLYNLTDLESILGVTHRTLLTYVKTGKLKATKIGGKWKVSDDNLKKFVNGED